MKPTYYSLILPLASSFFALSTATAQDLPTEFETADGDPVEVDEVCVAGAMEVPLTSITVDGDLSEWPEMERYDFPVLAWSPGIEWGETPAGSLPAESNVSGEWMAAWDSQFLYLAFDITDDASFQGDGIDIYIDGDLSRYEGTAYNQPGYDFVNDWQKIIYRDGTIEAGLHDTASVSTDMELEFEVMETDHGYNIEVSIRISSINSTRFMAEAGSYMGFDLNITDYDQDAENRTGVIGWCAESADTYADPSVFGVLVLMEEGGGSTGGNPWIDVAVNGGYKNTSELSAPGIGFIYDNFYPWIHSYGFGEGSGEWFYYLEAESEGENGFYGYNVNGSYFFWANSSWGYYYNFGDSSWNRFNGTE